MKQSLTPKTIFALLCFLLTQQLVNAQFNGFNTTLVNQAFYGAKSTYFADVNGDGKADAVVVNDGQIVARLAR